MRKPRLTHNYYPQTCPETIMIRQSHHSSLHPREQRRSEETTSLRAMRNSNRRLITALVATLVQSGGGRSGGNSPDLYAVLPADLQDAEDEVRCCEHAWRQAGAMHVSGPQVNQALHQAKELESEFNQAKTRSRPGVILRYLRLVRLFTLTGLPRFSSGAVIGVSAAIFCALSMLISPFVFSSLRSVFGCACILTVVGSSLATAVVLLLWPSETKLRSYLRRQQEWKDRKDRVEILRPSVVQAWTDYQTLLQHWTLYDCLEEAQQKQHDLAALLASEKYKLIHTDWRALRSHEFAQFLSHVFTSLGYQATLTKKSGDQGVDLLVIGASVKIAIQAKGYTDSVGNHSVMEVVAGMNFYQCTSCAVITNSRFTRAAEQLAQANACRLIDGAQIPDLIEGRIY
jgi:hypothetical protein